MNIEKAFEQIQYLLMVKTKTFNSIETEGNFLPGIEHAYSR